MAAEGAAVVERVLARGANRLERLVSLVLLGDLVSLYMAVLRGVDPVARATRSTGSSSGSLLPQRERHQAPELTREVLGAARVAVEQPLHRGRRRTRRRARSRVG